MHRLILDGNLYLAPLQDGPHVCPLSQPPPLSPGVYSESRKCSTSAAARESGPCESSERLPDANIQCKRQVLELLIPQPRDFADEHPSAQVTGVDLSPIQPSFVPPNCRFEVDNVNMAWTYPEDKFDFIHVRSLTGCVPDWVEFHKKAIK